GSALKTNPSLGFAVLTGVTRVSKESIFSGLNNLEVCSVLSDSYADAFGFTQEEAARLMEECGVGDRMSELKKWYDGYRFGQVEIYNPWSVICYIGEGCRFRPYWLNTSGNSILRDLLEHVDRRRQKELEGLLQGKGVEAPVMENVVYSDLSHHRDALFMMLMTAGYLKPVETWKDEDCADWVLLKIPNVEVRMAYRKEILGHIVPSQGEILLRDMLRSMTDGDAEGFLENLSELLRDFVSYHDAAQPESFHHGLLLGLSVLLDGKYRVESNRETGYGRFDIAFFPLKTNTPGVILELKSTKSEEELEEKAKEALRQIEEKAYITELSRQGVQEVWKYGIAFCGKKVWLERG
ncbi:MAG: AAA family ATPase, partial [Selenomonadaceae bacterium]|nr:AAA family ATPase [Selenomonadaceae bacterium]